MREKLKYLQIMVENSREIDAILEKISLENLPQEILTTIDKCRDDGGEDFDFDRYKEHLNGRIKDGANLIDLYMEMKVIEHAIEDSISGGRTLTKPFWYLVHKALK